MHECRDLALVAHRQYAPTDGIFQSQQSRAREVIVVGFDCRSNTRHSDAAVRLVLQRLRLNTAENRRAALLILIGMRLLTHQELIAAAAMSHQGGQIALRSARKEQRAFEAEALGGDGLQTVDGRVVAIHIIADFGGRHGGAHSGGRPGDRIAAQVDGKRGCVRTIHTVLQSKSTPKLKLFQARPFSAARLASHPCIFCVICSAAARASGDSPFKPLYRASAFSYHSFAARQSPSRCTTLR